MNSNNSTTDQATPTCENCDTELDEYGTFRGQPIFYSCDCSDQD